MSPSRPDFRVKARANRRFFSLQNRGRDTRAGGTSKILYCVPGTRPALTSAEFGVILRRGKMLRFGLRLRPACTGIGSV